MRQDAPHPRTAQRLVERGLRAAGGCSVERVAEGVSTFVYRVHRGSERFYLRILPEEDASFAPEVKALALLRDQGVRVPEVLYFVERDDELQRSVMLTTEIAERQLGEYPGDNAARRILHEAGRDLAVINRVAVDGFGWIERTPGLPAQLQAPHSSYRRFALEWLDLDLAALAGQVLSTTDTAAVRSVVEEAHQAWLTVGDAALAHGDFDVTAIFQQDGRYTGIIDFGEIRGTDGWYDLGHFRLHDGETVPVSLLDWLVEGYRSVTSLPDDYGRRVAFASLLIGVRALAGCLERRPEQVARHPGLRSIPRDLAALQG